jgi:hypothetical protein
LKNNERHDSKLTKFRYNEKGLQYLIWCENHLFHSYMGESGLEWGSMNGESKDPSIDNKFELNST